MNSEFPLAPLLARLKLDGLPPATHQGLAGLVNAFRVAVPFENLDALTGCTPAVTLDAIAEKIIRQGRGGWCYELNQLFAELLRLTGFTVSFRIARVGYRRPALGPLTHLVLLVAIDGREWLADVGFGGPAPSQPIPFETGDYCCDDGSQFRLMEAANGTRTLYRLIEGDWELLYEIAPITVQPIDLEMGSHFLATWPQSPFRRIFLCLAHEPERSWTMDGLDLVCWNPLWQVTSRRRISDGNQFHQVLTDIFHIVIAPELAEAAWQRVSAALVNG